ncbi:MAG: hypothetical protein H6746_12475 [Deltaproteobacteria bacterium]|nr:hypothetical protein [Deltaproteobacteria bacterium]
MSKREQGSGRRKGASRLIGRDDWERIVAAAANGVTGLRAIARAAGVSTATAKRAMAVGWPERGLPPVSEALAMRRATGRALAAVLPEVDVGADGVSVSADDLARAALPAALYQVAEESRTLEALRRLGVRLTQTAAQMADAADEVCVAALERLAADVRGGSVSPVDALRVVGTVATMSKTVTDLVGELMRLHRLALGHPGEIIGHRVIASPEEAVAMIDRATRAAQRARELGLVSMPGGMDGSAPEPC